MSLSADTIFALASGQGRAAVAIIRLSGPACAEALRRLVGRVPAPRQATLTTVVDPRTRESLDRGLVLWFPGPASFTGEDCAELHLHGSRAVVASVLDALQHIPGCRPAEPGEFTRRAFLHGKLDLSAVEGLADLIDAETEAQRRQALAQLDGALGRWVERLREGLLEACALAESAIDFADEGDVAADATTRALHAARGVSERIDAELAKPQAGERIRDGIAIAIAGPPNAGKSTLLNALAQRDVAIVSPHAGTTRDPIEVSLDLGGFAVRLIDTAGLRETVDPVEEEGVARARARAESADLVLWLQDGSTPPLPPGDLGQLWTVGSKADLLRSALGDQSGGYDILLSAETGQGLPILLERLQGFVADRASGGDAILITRLRHRAALEAVSAALHRATSAPASELLAEELRSAAAALGRITGKIDVEDILGAIFARFCIGK